MTNVIVLMAGAGSRFSEAEYTTIKPLIGIDNATILHKSVWSMGIGGRYIYIVQAEHSRKYDLKKLLPTLTPNLEVIVVEIDGLSEGPAASALAAKEYINDEDMLVISNCDQIIEWVPNEFLRDAGERRHLDGSIATFTAEGSQWSYAKTDSEGMVTEVAEKNQISDQATAGVYYWRKGSDFVKYAEQMISKDLRVNGEFYVGPVYNEAILDRQVVGVYKVDKMTPLGTPEDLTRYLESN